MELTMEQLSKLQTTAPNSGEPDVKTNVGDVFKSKTNGFYLNEFYLFTTHFNTIPNFVNAIDIDCRKAIPWFVENYNQEIKDCHYDKIYNDSTKKVEFDDVFFFIYEDLMIDFDTNNNKVRFFFRHTDCNKIEKIIEVIKKFKNRKKDYSKPEISLLINRLDGLCTKSLEILKPKLSIEDNYNCDFKSIHQTIVKRLSKKNDKGLVLLYGKPGTGKTSYIRYLIASVKKNVIFLPPNMASAITNPNLISVLIDNPNSIFVIEDAENIVIDRELNGASPVSALLNISDGLLADCLNIQLICSFNTDISKVDSALLRKGRLIAQYEFKELEIAKAQALSYKLGFDSIISRPMALTEIYNQNEQDFTAQKQRRSIGFGAA